MTSRRLLRHLGRVTEGRPHGGSIDPLVFEQLGGFDRLSVTHPRLAHDDLLCGIELAGTEVAPMVAVLYP